MEKLFYTINDLVEMLSMSKFQILTYRKKGTINSLPNRRPMLFSKKEVDNLKKIENEKIDKN